MRNNNTQPTNQNLLEAINKIDKRVNGIEVNNSLILQAIGQFSTETDQRFDGMEDRLATLENGQEEIKLRIGNKANAMDLKQLERRVDLLTTN